MKYLKILLLVAVLAGGSVFYVKHTDKVNAQVGACDTTKVKTSILNLPVTSFDETEENVAILRFVIKNENTSSSCPFILKNFKLQELINYNGSVISELQVVESGVNFGNELIVSKVADEIAYQRSISDINSINLTIAPGAQKQFTVLATEFGNVSSNGDAFAVGVQWVNGFLGTNIPVNNWNYPIKWGPIVSVQ